MSALRRMETPSPVSQLHANTDGVSKRLVFRSRSPLPASAARGKHAAKTKMKVSPPSSRARSPTRSRSTSSSRSPRGLLSRLRSGSRSRSRSGSALRSRSGSRSRSRSRSASRSRSRSRSPSPARRRAATATQASRLAKATRGRARPVSARPVQKVQTSPASTLAGVTPPASLAPVRVHATVPEPPTEPLWVPIDFVGQMPFRDGQLFKTNIASASANVPPSAPASYDHPYERIRHRRTEAKMKKKGSGSKQVDAVVAPAPGSAATGAGSAATGAGSAATGAGSAAKGAGSAATGAGARDVVPAGGGSSLSSSAAELAPAEVAVSGALRLQLSVNAHYLAYCARWAANRIPDSLYEVVAQSPLAWSGHHRFFADNTALLALPVLNPPPAGHVEAAAPSSRPPPPSGAAASMTSDRSSGSSRSSSGRSKSSSVASGVGAVDRAQDDAEMVKSSVQWMEALEQQVSRGQHTYRLAGARVIGLPVHAPAVWVDPDVRRTYPFRPSSQVDSFSSSAAPRLESKSVAAPASRSYPIEPEDTASSRGGILALRTARAQIEATVTLIRSRLPKPDPLTAPSQSVALSTRLRYRQATALPSRATLVLCDVASVGWWLQAIRRHGLTSVVLATSMSYEQTSYRMLLEADVVLVTHPFMEWMASSDAASLSVDTLVARMRERSYLPRTLPSACSPFGYRDPAQHYPHACPLLARALKREKQLIFEDLFYPLPPMPPTDTGLLERFCTLDVFRMTGAVSPSVEGRPPMAFVESALRRNPPLTPRTLYSVALEISAQWLKETPSKQAEFRDGKAKASYVATSSSTSSAAASSAASAHLARGDAHLDPLLLTRPWLEFVHFERLVWSQDDTPTVPRDPTLPMTSSAAWVTGDAFFTKAAAAADEEDHSPPTGLSKRGKKKPRTPASKLLDAAFHTGLGLLSSIPSTYRWFLANGEADGARLWIEGMPSMASVLRFLDFSAPLHPFWPDYFSVQNDGPPLPVTKMALHGILSVLNRHMYRRAVPEADRAASVSREQLVYDELAREQANQSEQRQQANQQRAQKAKATAERHKQRDSELRRATEDALHGHLLNSLS